jgi:hypothetical protein
MTITVECTHFFQYVIYKFQSVYFKLINANLPVYYYYYYYSYYNMRVSVRRLRNLHISRFQSGSNSELFPVISAIVCTW